jgi:DNA-binding NtrC family response regulator
VPGYDQNRIAHLEERLAVAPVSGASAALSELEMLADLYLQADSYVPALATIERLLALPEASTLSALRRAVLESKAISCRLAQGDCQAALGHAREVLNQEAAIGHPAILSRLHLLCSEALFRLSRLDPCRESAERALELADGCGDLSLAALALDLLGRHAYRQGQLPRARDFYEQALALYQRIGDKASSAAVRNNLGLVHKNLCEWDAAISHLLAALELHRASGRFAKTGDPLTNLGVVYQKSGDWKRAAEAFGQAQQVYASVGDQLRLNIVAIGLGTIARLERRFAEAHDLLTGALSRARDLGAKREEVLALEFLGEVELDQGHGEAALAFCREGLPLAERVAAEGDLVLEVERRRAEALLQLGRLDEAEVSILRAQKLARLTQDRFEHAITCRVVASIAWARGQRDEAFRSWNEAVTRFNDCRARFELARTLLDFGRAHEDAAMGRRHLFRAVALFAELGTPHWLEVAERDLQHALTVAPEPAAIRPSSLLGRRLRAPSLVACSSEMRRVEHLSQRAAGTDLSVIITGETGVGKELVARTIHSLSSRQGRPFLAVNCGALRADLALSQLFGHRKGAFTGAHVDSAGLVEAAHGGTLFMDEVGELPADVQVTLLRFLESGEYLRLGETQVRRADVRLIAATNRELHDEKLFRRDLLFRLNEIEIRVPELRQRREDIVPLARHFLAFYGGIGGPRLAAEAESLLVSYGWPGNVRELENVMKRVAALHSGDDEVDAVAMIPFLSDPSRSARAPEPRIERDDREVILSAYSEARGNKSRVAQILGISRKTLYARLKRLKIELP